MRIIVTSSHKMKKCWEPFHRLFKKYWPDCPWRRTLVTDRYDGGWDEDVVSFDKDFGYSANLLQAISKIEDEVILLIMEDMFLNTKVDTEYVKMAVGLMEEQPKYYGMFRLYPCPGSDVDIPETEEYGYISKGARYRVSCMAALWQTSILKKILPQTSTAWDFELKGTEISRGLQESFFSVKRERKSWPFSHFATAVTRGKWEKSAIDFCKKHGIEV